MRADWIEALLVALIRDAVNSDDVRNALKQSILVEASKIELTVDTAALQEDLKHLESKLRRASRNLLEAPDEALGDCRVLINEMRDERKRLQTSLAAAMEQSPTVNIEARVQAALDELSTLHVSLRDSDLAISRRAFRTLFHRVTIHWHEQKARYHNRFVSKVVIESSPRHPHSNTTPTHDDSEADSSNQRRCPSLSRRWN